MKTRLQPGKIRKRLLDRSADLRSDIQRELRKYDNERYIDLAGRVADPGEQSVADLLSDIDIAEVNRDVVEFREIEAALLRLAEGRYGNCVDCEEAIDPLRLETSPEAARCLECQQKFENRGREVRYRKL